MKFDTKEEFLGLCRRVVHLFDFVKMYGYKPLQEKWPISNDFRDGFSVAYQSENSQVRIEYFDMEFNVYFYRGSQAIPFYLIDKYVFESKSGFQGDMFPREKLEAAATKIAAQIQTDFTEILKGEDVIWEKLLKQFEEPEEKRK